MVEAIAKPFAGERHLTLPTVEELQLELRRERQAIEEAIAPIEDNAL